MLFGSGLAILLLLATSSAQTSPQTTDQLQLPEPQRIPPGHFDRLQCLRRVTLSGNPFHCNCEIQYLSTWLKGNGAVVSGGGPTCASPSSMAHTAITVLSDAYWIRDTHGLRISLPAKPSLTRTTLGKLCVAPRTSRLRPVTTEPGREPRVSGGAAGAAVQHP
uniref:LRRCT domain-containing protein n=1 Tax=Oncorhynchus tshawytscha TaxID=74940 RepID=A0AAZ3SMP9_ONCTS